MDAHGVTADHITRSCAQNSITTPSTPLIRSAVDVSRATPPSGSSTTLITAEAIQMMVSSRARDNAGVPRMASVMDLKVGAPLSPGDYANRMRNG